MTERIAVVLLNNGGPDTKRAILPYLYNYYKDRHNLPLPFGLQNIAAFFIALIMRFSISREMYRQLGFQSPLLQNTKTQAISLERVLNASKTEDVHYRCFAGMNYWHPFFDEVMQEIKTYGADRVILLPMFPQFSFKTNFTMLEDWFNTAEEESFAVKTQIIPHFHNVKGFIEAAAAQISPSMYRISDKARRANLSKPRIVFLARYHSPRFLRKKDPYTAQIQQTAESILKAIGGEYEHRICYQLPPFFFRSVKPYITDILKEGGKDNMPLLIYPLSYSCEDPNTMIAMDKHYAGMAEKLNVPLYERALTVGNHNDFIAGLVDMIINEDDKIIDAPKQKDQLKNVILKALSS